MAPAGLIHGWEPIENHGDAISRPLQTFLGRLRKGSAKPADDAATGRNWARLPGPQILQSIQHVCWYPLRPWRTLPWCSLSIGQLHAIKLAREDGPAPRLTPHRQSQAEIPAGFGRCLLLNEQGLDAMTKRALTKYLKRVGASRKATRY